MNHTVALADIVAALDAELRTADIADYPGAINGLQVGNTGYGAGHSAGHSADHGAGHSADHIADQSAGRGADHNLRHGTGQNPAHISRVSVAVDASLATIHAAIATGANLLIVHHGLFWNGAQPITGTAYAKWHALMTHNIAVYSTHLPLDAHPTLGNNTLLARALGLTPTSGFARFKTIDIGVAGDDDLDSATLVSRVRTFAQQHGGMVRTSVRPDKRRTKRWAICTGGGASTETLREARERGIDTLIVGEGPHHTTVEAQEQDLLVIYAGHYATETLGVQAVGAWLEARFALPWSFLHLPTGS